MLAAGGRHDSAETNMQNLPATPELRSPQFLLRKLRRNAARIEVAVAAALVLSICTVLFAISHGPAASLSLVMLA
jgi:hypothetical protein